MTSAFESKPFVAGLVDILSQAIMHDRLDDAEHVLACVRVLRPKLPELDTFDAWIAMKRGFWPDAIRILRNVDAASANWALGKALMAFCQFALGDSAWRATATDVLENGRSAEASTLVNLLIDPEGAVSEKAQSNAAPAAPATPMPPASELPQGTYLRA